MRCAPSHPGSASDTTEVAFYRVLESNMCVIDAPTFLLRNCRIAKWPVQPIRRFSLPVRGSGIE